MRWCAETGTPHSQLLNWEPEDRNKLTAHLLEEVATCPQCGTRADEWDPEQGGSRRAYVPEAHICPGCELKELAATDEANQDRRGLYVVLKPTHST